MYLFTPFTSLYRTIRDSNSSNMFLNLTRSRSSNDIPTPIRPTTYDNSRFTPSYDYNATTTHDNVSAEWEDEFNSESIDPIQYYQDSYYTQNTPDTANVCIAFSSHIYLFIHSSIYSTLVPMENDI